jgi:hypothetical protein
VTGRGGIQLSHSSSVNISALLRLAEPLEPPVIKSLPSCNWAAAALALNEFMLTEEIHSLFSKEKQLLEGVPF